jgi:diguanylate cyclase (GGDEF)-like protein
VQQGYEKAALAVLFINVLAVFLVARRPQVDNAIALQFGLMAVSFSGTLLGAIATERWNVQEQLYKKATHDTLTELYNRNWFMERLRQSLMRNQRDADYQFAIFFLDLDRFKAINNTFGHHVGDKLLIEISKRLIEIGKRPKPDPFSNSEAARLGGDEFILLLEDCSTLTAVRTAAQHLCERLSQRYQINGYEIPVTVSVGVTMSTFSYKSLDDLLRDVDVALRQSKANGRSQYTLFDQNMYERVSRQAMLENDLQRAVSELQENHDQTPEFKIHYQPIINLKTSKITGFEALLRWRNRDQDWVSPDEFIPIGENTGLIVPLGAWVLRQACEQMQLWRQMFPHADNLFIAVNLSGKQLSQPALTDVISTVLQDTNLPAPNLKIELTESTVMQDFQVTESFSQGLRALKANLSIDDFGTGHSSLSRLYRMNADIVKIDRSFVSQMSNSRAAYEIVRIIIELAHTLDMLVIAEGVETEEQATQLKALQCEEGQGYFFFRPLPSAAIAALIAQGLSTDSDRG